MFKLATVKDWWDITRSPDLNFLRSGQRIGSPLKCIGYSFVISKIKENKPRTILEFGHAHTSPLFGLFGEQCEMWGIDEALADYTTQKELEDFRKRHEKLFGAKFIIGYLGEESSDLPDSYFDLVCSVSAVEHIPTENLEKVFKEIARILRPGGLVVNSYDVPYGMYIGDMFDAHIKAGLEWLESDSRPVLNWDAKDVCFEDPRNILRFFTAHLPDEERTQKWSGNYATVLMGARKSEEEIVKLKQEIAALQEEKHAMQKELNLSQKVIVALQQDTENLRRAIADTRGSLADTRGSLRIHRAHLQSIIRSRYLNFGWMLGLSRKPGWVDEIRSGSHLSLGRKKGSIGLESRTGEAMQHGTDYPVYLDYRPASIIEPRWGYGKPPHPLLYIIIDRGRKNYERLLCTFLNYKDKYLCINRDEDEQEPWEPHLTTPWFPGLDSLALYCILAIYKPSKYVEIGSGNSTKFARRSIQDNHLKTQVISIDPEPRAIIDRICDQVIRKPVEQVDCSFFDRLEVNDILFVDCSHRCFMNSDVTVILLDIIPRLKSGVLVEIHDIFLPDDYLPSWGERYYSEQYLLAAYLLAEGQKFDIVLPNGFISKDPHLHGLVNQIFSEPDMNKVIRGGGSFWLRIR